MNVNSEAINLLTEARIVLHDPTSWCKNAHARDMFGQPVDPASKSVDKRSLKQSLNCYPIELGAIRTLATQAVVEAIKAVTHNCPVFMRYADNPAHCLVAFNDYKTIDHSHILKVIDTAIEIVKENDPNETQSDS